MGKILALIAVLLLGVQAYSQTMVIHNSDGSSVRIAIADINKITFTLGTAGITPRPEVMTKTNMIFAKIFPNPFKTRIEYSVQDHLIHISVLNMQGKIVRTLLNQYLGKGNYTALWDANDSGGKKVVNGAYINIRISDKLFSKSLYIVK